MKHRRNCTPHKGVYVPRIILPLRLPRHTIDYTSCVDVPLGDILVGWKNFVAKHEVKGNGVNKWVYVHRKT